MKKILSSISIFLLLTSLVNSAEVTIPVSQTAVICSGFDSNYGRLLFKFDLPKELDSAFIDYSEIIFKAEPEPSYSNAKLIVIAAYPLSRDWSADNVSWTSPWTNPGGDYIDSIYCSALLFKSEDYQIGLDITPLVRLWIDNSLSNYGLILLPLGSDCSLKLSRHSSLENNANALVKIYYTPPDRKLR